MSKRPTDREKLLFKLNHLSDHEIKEVLNYISGLEKTRVASPHPDIGEDDLVALLSGAYENLRARQIFEWESVRRKAEVRASIQRYVSR